MTQTFDVLSRVALTDLPWQLVGANLYAMQKDNDLSKDVLVACAVDALVTEMKPMRIYVFGSRGNGTARAGSDLDLMVVMRDGEGDKLSNAKRAYRATRSLPCAKDILINNESAFQRRAKWSSSIERKVLEEGQLVYGDT